MLSFESDYILGAHERVLDALVRTNSEVLSGYGNDIHTKSAKELIKKACNSPDADVHFLVGGTQTNQIVISTMLKAFEAVIAPKTGHVALHEVGAIEYTGHKVIELPEKEGKLSAETVEKYVETFLGDENNVMMVRPGMVYISYPTEYGTLYTKSELTASAIIDGLIKLSALPIIGFRGFLDGYRYAKETKSAWFETKRRVLEAFLLKKSRV